MVTFHLSGFYRGSLIHTGAECFAKINNIINTQFEILKSVKTMSHMFFLAFQYHKTDRGRGRERERERKRKSERDREKRERERGGEG